MSILRRAALAAVVTASVLVSNSAPASATFNGYVISTIAGNGTYGYSGDGGPATSAQLGSPYTLSIDSTGNLYESDDSNYIRKIAANGIITTFAGSATVGYSGDGGPATSAQVHDPAGLTFDASGNAYFADSGNHVVRKVSSGGIISTFAGTGTAGAGGDGGQALAAQLDSPSDVVFDKSGNLYVSDFQSHNVRKIAPNGIISTVVGNGANTDTGNGGAATSASITSPDSIAFDSQSNLYIADEGNFVRKVSPGGIITNFAGTGGRTETGDGGPATSATLQEPYGLAVDALDNVYVADGSGTQVRKIATNGIITSVAGNGTYGYSGDGGSATNAQLSEPCDLAIDAQGNLYIADYDYSIIRKVALLAPATATTSVQTVVDPTFTFSLAGRSSACNGSTAPTGVATPTSIDLGHITPASPVIGAQDFTAATNAGGGFSVSVKFSGPMTSTSTSATIANASGTAGSPAAFGTGEHFGYTTSANAGFSGPLWAGPSTSYASLFATSSAATVSNCIAYQVAVASTTPAGAYAVTVTYLAVPNF